MNQKQALTLGLYLAVTAPTDEHAERMNAMWEGLTCGMSTAEVAKCKRAAMARVRREDRRRDGIIDSRRHLAP